MTVQCHDDRGRKRITYREVNCELQVCRFGKSITLLPRSEQITLGRGARLRRVTRAFRSTEEMVKSAGVEEKGGRLQQDTLNAGTTEWHLRDKRDGLGQFRI